MAHTIELRKVSKYYANEDSISMGFSSVDLKLDIGEFVVITGESGSGKSTLLNVISGLDSYEEGEMFVCGQDTSAFNEEDYENYRKTYICNIFQDFNLVGSYTVYQNVELVMLIAGYTGGECRKKVLEILEQVGMSSFARTKVSKLSGGQKQRVAIARAIAKDAPVIVADEPTGNLDSESAASVMKILSEVAGDKLVVIVTHNYEQAEPYMSRKLTMHDGCIIEDRHISTDREEPDGSETGIDEATDTAGRKLRSAAGGMRKSTVIGLGIRNAFNLPLKFILLLTVYLFVSTAVLAQYASTINSIHQSELTGINPYFINTSPERLIIKRDDEGVLKDEDAAAIGSTDNIGSVVLNDLGVDNFISFSLGDYYIKGAVYPVSRVSEDSITYGRMPRSEYEIVVHAGASSGAFLGMSDIGESMIGSEVMLQDIDQKYDYDVGHPVTVAGIIIDDTYNDNTDYDLYGESEIFVSDRLSNELMTYMTAANSVTDIRYGETEITIDHEIAVIPSDKAAEGKVYITREQKYNYEDGKARGKELRISVHNRYYDERRDFEVAEVVNTGNINDLLGMSDRDYVRYRSCVFVSRQDFEHLYNKGSFQASAFMADETESDVTVSLLAEKGYAAVAVKDTLTDTSGVNRALVRLMDYCRLVLGFLLLFLVSYAVIRLIMRSRNSYYSILRMLGATRKNTGGILRTELVLMMLIAYTSVIGAVLLVRYGYIVSPGVSSLLRYLSPADYCVLAAVLIIMSLLIAGRFSRKLFSGSVMSVFREEI